MHSAELGDGQCPFMLSDYAEAFTTDSPKHSPAVESVVLIFDVFIRIYKILNIGYMVLRKTSMCFFHKKKVRFSQTLKTTSEIVP